MLGTDSDVLRHAGPSEQARVEQVLKHLLPVSPRYGGMQFDIKTTAAHEPLPFEKHVGSSERAGTVTDRCSD